MYISRELVTCVIILWLIDAPVIINWIVNINIVAIVSLDEFYCE